MIYYNNLTISNTSDNIKHIIKVYYNSLTISNTLSWSTIAIRHCTRLYDLRHTILMQPGKIVGNNRQSMQSNILSGLCVNALD